MDYTKASSATIVCAICQHDSPIGAPCPHCGNFTCPDCNIPLIHHRHARRTYRCVRCQAVYGLRLVVTTETGTFIAWPEGGE